MAQFLIKSFLSEIICQSAKKMSEQLEGDKKSASFFSKLRFWRGAKKDEPESTAGFLAGIEGSGEAKKGFIFDSVIKYGIYILAFLLPLFFLPFTANITDLNKQLLLVVASFVLFAVWLFKILIERRLQIKRSLLNILIILFLVSVLVSSLLAKNAYQAFVGVGGTLAESFLSVVCLAIIFFLVSNVFKKRKEFTGLFYALFAGAFLAGIFGLLQASGKFIFGWDFSKINGFNTVGTINALEIFLGAALVLLVAFFTDQKRSLRQLVFLAAGTVAILFMLISFNFPNIWWALIGVMVLVIGIGLMKQGRSSQTRLILAMLVLAMALLLTLTKLNVGGGWLSIPADVSPSYVATVAIDKSALGERLFFGSGPGTFAYNWELFRSPLINQTIFWNIRFTQGLSKVSSLPATLGIFGTGMWLAIIVFFAIWGAWRLIRRRSEDWALAFGFYTAWLFIAVMQFLYPATLTLEFLFWLLMGASFALLKNLKEESEQKEAISLSFTKESPLASLFSFIFVLFLVLTVSFFYLGFNYWRADILFQKGVNASNASDLGSAYDNIAKAATLNPYRDTYLVALSQVALLRANAELAKPRTADRDLKVQQFIADSVNFSKAASEVDANNPDNWTQRGLVYRSVIGYLSGAEDWMISTFQEAVKLEPQNPYAFFQLGQSYSLLASYTLAQGQTKENQDKATQYLSQAEEQFNNAVAVKPDYAPAHYQLALIYDQEGKVDSAIAKMEMTKATFPSDVGVAFQLGLLYYKKQDFAKAQAEFERAVTMDANYSNARYFLGLIFDHNGDKASARDQFQKIAELNPDSVEVKNILANLEAGKPALAGIVPPAAAPENRSQQPVPEAQPQTK